jgi:diguanylate cyclase (GGDEF)-like protein
MQIYHKTDRQMYIRAVDGSEIALWEWDVVNNSLFLSSNFEAVTSYGIKDFKSPAEFIELAVVTEDSLSIKNTFISFLENNLDSHESSFKIQSKSGAILHVLSRVKATKKTDGKVKLISGSIINISNFNILENRIDYISNYNLLTNLPNKALLKKDLKRALDTSKKGVIILLNIDNFKLINDNYDHNFGDLLLIVFSQSISHFKNSHTKLYHLHGNEFLFLCINQEENLIKNLYSKINNFLKQPFKINGESIYITISIGISRFPIDSTSEETLFKYADIALCESKSKSKSKNTVTLFQKSMHYSYLRKIIIEQELKNAVRNNELELMYQPQIDVVSENVIGFEALLRWKNHRLGNVPPSEFIPIAEDSGSIIEIGYWIFDSVFKFINDLKLKHTDLKKFSINISPVQLSDPEFIDKLSDLYNRNKIPPSTVEIEITERSLLDLFVHNLKTLQKILNMGIRLSLDDFGTGYSSLNYLTMLPVNTIKIDKSFIDKIYSKKNKAVIKCIIDLSKILNYNIIAEGVETSDQLNSLLEMGCNTIQGYYFSKPVIKADVITFLQQKEVGF